MMVKCHEFRKLQLKKLQRLLVKGSLHCWSFDQTATGSGLARMPRTRACILLLIFYLRGFGAFPKHIPLVRTPRLLIQELRMSLRGGMVADSMAKVSSCGLRLTSECGGRLLAGRGDFAKSEICLLEGTGQRFTLNPFGEGAFLQMDGSIASRDKHMIDLGCLPRGTQALACSLQKLWWLYPRIIADARTEPVPVETQFLLLQLDQDGHDDAMYALVLPFVNGKTRSSLKGGSGGNLNAVCETGCSKTSIEQQVEAWPQLSAFMMHRCISDRLLSYKHTTNTVDFTSSPQACVAWQSDFAYISVGRDPFHLVSEGFECLAKRTGTFKTMKQKNLPNTASLFGWCTWDAFYHAVSGTGIEAGLTCLSHGGTPARFLIIDDGWQVGACLLFEIH
jgi:hypothetical protein